MLRCKFPMMTCPLGQAFAWRRLRTIAAALTIVMVFLPNPVASDETKLLDKRACSEAGKWLDPKTGEFIRPDVLMARLSDAAVVLLGENHTTREHHLWQAQMLAALNARQQSLVVGFEMFPRAVQPALDQWARGELSRDDFLRAARWNEVWGYDPDFYMPLFDFVRQNRLGMIGLNVDRRLISSVGEKGWDGVPEDRREGVTKPAPASEAYRSALAQVYAAKQSHRKAADIKETDQQKAAVDAPDSEVDLAAIMKQEDFGRFVEAQQTWDRAMAEALAAARKASPGAQVVGILGRGHVEHGYGVPHQLRNLGIKDVVVLLPLEVGESCEHSTATLAEAVFLVDAPPAADRSLEKPLLGVMIKTAEGGVQILGVRDGSVAQAAKLAEGDIVFSAAGTPVRRNEDLIAIVQRQAPGTWLPLGIRRGGQELPIIAKFPAQAVTSP